MKVLTQKKNEDYIPYRVVCIDDKFTKPTVVYRGENAAFEFIKAILQEHKYCTKIRNKHFKHYEEEEHLSQQSSSCWTFISTK